MSRGDASKVLRADAADDDVYEQPEIAADTPVPVSTPVGQDAVWSLAVFRAS